MNRVCPCGAAPTTALLLLNIPHNPTHRNQPNQQKDLSLNKVALRGKNKEDMEQWCALAIAAAAPRGAK